MLDIKIERTTAPKEKPNEDKLGFGQIFTDHMYIMDYNEGQGWHDPRIVPYAPISGQETPVSASASRRCLRRIL